MDKKTFWIIAGIVIVVLLALVIWQTAKISSIDTSQIASSAGSAVASQASGGMVGGC